MSHAEIVVSPNGWNGWAVHVSQANHAINLGLQPWSVRLAANSPEMQAFHAAYPLDSGARVTHYWTTLVKHLPPSNRAGLHAWMREAALETVRAQHYPNRMSRLDSVFGFLCFADAIRFACHHREGGLCYLHEVQSAPAALLADMKLWDECNWDYAQPQAAFDTLIQMATAYWNSATTDLNAPGMGRPEVLMPAPVTVSEPAIPFERAR